MKKDAEKIRDSMIKDACKKFGRVLPCGKLKSFDGCFTWFDGQVLFWFNTTDGSTHVIRQLLEQWNGFGQESNTMDTIDQLVV